MYVLIVMQLMTGQTATWKFPTDQTCESVKADFIKHRHKAICVEAAK